MPDGEMKSPEVLSAGRPPAKIVVERLFLNKIK